MTWFSVSALVKEDKENKRWERSFGESPSHRSFAFTTGTKAQGRSLPPVRVLGFLHIAGNLPGNLLLATALCFSPPPKTVTFLGHRTLWKKLCTLSRELHTHLEFCAILQGVHAPLLKFHSLVHKPHEPVGNPSQF